MENNNSDRINQQLSKIDDEYPPLDFSLRLNTLANSKTSLARVIREFSKGRINHKTYRALLHGFTVYHQFLKSADIEMRVDQIERKLEALK